MHNAHRLQLASSSGMAGGGFLLLFGLLVAFGANPNGTSAAIVFAIGALLLLGVPLGLHLLRASGDGWLARVGTVVTLLGLTLWIVGMFAILADPASADSQLFTPLAAILSPVGMLLLGIGALRVQRLEGWRRFSPLLPALYYIIMTPIQAVFFIGPSNNPSYELIGLWGAAWLASAWGIHSVKRTAIASPAA